MSRKKDDLEKIKLLPQTYLGKKETAESAKTLATARSIFGQNFNGSSNVQGRAMHYGNYTATPGSRYTTSALEIRENGLVTNTQSDIGYAPTIGFHWGGRIAATLAMNSSGEFQFINQAGTGYSNVRAGTFIGALSGNASTASSLATARTINGTAFNGSGNITTANWGTARTLTVGNTGKSVNGSGNVSWSLTEIGAAPSSHEHGWSGSSTNTFIAYPSDGRWRHKTSQSTGYLKITLPQSWTSTMLRFEVDIYDYTTNGSVTYVVGGYNYGDGTWQHSPFAYCMSNKDSNKNNLTVRLGHDGSKCAIYIGEASTVWSYAQVTIKNITAGYSNYESSKWNAGWGIGVTTSLGTITATITNTSVSHGGMAKSLLTARNINGTAFNGTGDIVTSYWGTARTLTIGNTGKSVNGSGNVSWSLSEIGAAPASHTHSYLPLSGGSMTGTITSSLTTSTHLNGNKGVAIINSTAAGNGYTMLAKMNSTNGVWTLGGWTTNFDLFYTANSTITAGTNSYTKRLTLLNEAGNSSFPGTVSAAAFSGNASSASVLQTARTLTIGNTGKSFNGSANLAWSLSEIGAASASHNHDGTYMKQALANSYYGMTANGDASNWVRTTINGIIPYQSGGASSLGTSSWPFNNIYANNIYDNGVLLENKFAAASHLHSTYLYGTGDHGSSKVTDYKYVWKSGFYDGENVANSPFTGWTWMIHAAHTNNSGSYRYGLQIVAQNATHNFAMRTVNQYGDGTWNVLYHNNNKPTYADVGAMTAGTAPRISNANNITGNGIYAFSSGSVNVPCTYGIIYHGHWNTSQTASQFCMNVTGPGTIYFRTNNNGWSAWRAV